MTAAPIQTLLKQATEHHRAGRLPQAEALYRNVLALQPDNGHAMHMLGLLSAQSGNLDAAIDLMQQSIKQSPRNAAFLNNLGNALRERGRLDESITAYQQAIQIQPTFADPHGNLGNALRDKGLLDDAIASFQRAVHLNPNYFEAFSNLGNALRDKGELDSALIAYSHALGIEPRLAEVHNNLGNVFKDKAMLDESVTSYRRALELKPNHIAAHSNLLFTLPYHPDYDPPAILKEAIRWDQMHAHPLRKEIKPHTNDRNPARRLRIGYVSPDFREHCQSLFTIPLLGNHDHKNFEIICYADIRRPDAITDRIRSYTDIWRSTVGVADAQLAQIIRNDRIDILIDLTMHMSKGRPLLFARKPAPLQVAWLAYPGTTGLSTMDYRLTDPHLDPPGTDADYREKTIRLPDSFWCYDPLTTEPAPGPLPALRNGHITFGCLNNFCKLTPLTLKLWIPVLRALPSSRMLILASPGDHRQKLLQTLEQTSIDPDRIDFTPYRPRAQYLHLYQKIDIGLDTLPANGYTTSLDSFWMGVPVITRVGKSALGRAGWSQLTNLNLPELAAETDADFTRIARELANDLPRLSDLRFTLRQRMQNSPLMDGPRFARNMETIYREIWRAYCYAASS